MSGDFKTLTIARRLQFSALTLAFFLACTELALTALPPLLRPQRGPGLDDVTGSDTVIYVIGDSVAFGTGVSAEGSWPAQLYTQLVGLGAQDIRVINDSREGAGVGKLTEAADAIAQLGPVNHLLVVVMVGHNSFIHWRGLHTTHEQLTRSSAPGDSSADDLAQRIRLLRILRWVETAVRQEPPEIDTLDTHEIGGFHNVGGTFARFVADRGGSLYLATYVVPGAPGPDMPEDEAAVIAATRSGQIAINQIIRDVAASSGAGLLDLEAVPLFAPIWDERDFTDHIHLTVAGNAAVAGAVRTMLVQEGELPPAFAP